MLYYNYQQSSGCSIKNFNEEGTKEESGSTADISIDCQ